MLIRNEQMTVFENAAEENFVRRLSAHLVENYSSTMVHLPDAESSIGELSGETLYSLVKVSIERARSYGLTFESSISAFSATMFAVSPNFDRHRLSQVMLNDENLTPEDRFNELVEFLTEKNWETIRADYNVYEWQPRTAANVEESESAATGDSVAADSVVNQETPQRKIAPVSIDDISFDETIRNYESARRIEKG